MEDSSSTNEGNFGFGFNDIDFSDRVLRLEIILDGSECGNDFDFKVQTLHINSLILAAKSPFFYKLFKNGMRESQRRVDVTLRINASEESAFMDVLNFMYGNPLSATSAADLLEVLMAADKFDVTSCTKHCINLLLKLPMSTDSAIIYLELPSNVLEAEVVQPLINSAKRYLVAHYKDFTKFKEDAMSLPLSALEVVLGSDGLEVDSEDVVFELVMKWARVHYPKPEERREILTKRLMRLICFPNLSSSKDCSDFGFPTRIYKNQLNENFENFGFSQARIVKIGPKRYFPGRST